MRLCASIRNAGLRPGGVDMTAEEAKRWAIVHAMVNKLKVPEKYKERIRWWLARASSYYAEVAGVNISQCYWDDAWFNVQSEILDIAPMTAKRAEWLLAELAELNPEFAKLEKFRGGPDYTDYNEGETRGLVPLISST